MTKYRPTNDLVLISPGEIEELSPGGIVVPGSAQKSALKRGTVVAVGLGRMLENGQRNPIQMAVGDAVRYVEGRNSVPTTLEGVKYFLMDEGDVLLVEEPNTGECIPAEDYEGPHDL